MSQLTFIENSPQLQVIADPSHLDFLAASGLFEVVNIGVENAIRPRLNRVGVVVVGETRYEVKPKLSISQLFFLMSFGQRDFFLESSFQAEENSLWGLIARVFYAYTHRAVGRGLIYDYVSTNDALPLVKGTIRVSDQMARRSVVPLPLEVTYDDYSPNIVENKILKTALKRVQMLPGIQPDIRRYLRQLEIDFAEVDTLPRGSAVPHWTSNRRNLHYQPALKLARMILQSMSPSERTGEHSMLAFVVNLPQVFEDFLEAQLREYYRGISGRIVQVSAQNSSYLDREKLIKIRPDLSFRSAGQVVAIADAKYKVGDLNKSASNNDIYQLITYCKHFGLPEGHLIIAGSVSGQKGRTVHHLPNVGVTLTSHYLDLSQDSDQVIEQVRDLARNILAS